MDCHVLNRRRDPLEVIPRRDLRLNRRGGNEVLGAGLAGLRIVVMSSFDDGGCFNCDRKLCKDLHVSYASNFPSLTGCEVLLIVLHNA